MTKRQTQTNCVFSMIMTLLALLGQEDNAFAVNLNQSQPHKWNHCSRQALSYIIDWLILRLVVSKQASPGSRHENKPACSRCTSHVLFCTVALNNKLVALQCPFGIHCRTGCVLKLCSIENSACRYATYLTVT